MKNQLAIVGIVSLMISCLFMPVAASTTDGQIARNLKGGEANAIDLEHPNIDPKDIPEHGDPDFGEKMKKLIESFEHGRKLESGYSYLLLYRHDNYVAPYGGWYLSNARGWWNMDSAKNDEVTSALFLPYEKDTQLHLAEHHNGSGDTRYHCCKRGSWCGLPKLQNCGFNDKMSSIDFCEWKSFTKCAWYGCNHCTLDCSWWGCKHVICK